MSFRLPLLFILLSLSIPSLGESMDDLNSNSDGCRFFGTFDELDFNSGDCRFYKKGSVVPFTGSIDEGSDQGAFENGRREHLWVRYFKGGDIFEKGNYKNGKKEGIWETYWIGGNLATRGEYKNGLAQGPWVGYWPDESLWFKGVYENGMGEGRWIAFKIDGSVNEKSTGTFKKGKNISRGFYDLFDSWFITVRKHPVSVP